MKKCFILGVLFIFFGLCLYYNKNIVAFMVGNFSEYKRVTTSLENNTYASINNYEFVQLTDNFEPHSKQEIINIYYTVLNSGMKKFVFHCPLDYKTCVEDVDYISNDQVLLSNINNFISVYNGFKNIETEYDSLGKVEINITKSYNAAEVVELNATVKKILSEVVNDDMSIEIKIKNIHDYIINNTKYDKERSDNKVTKYKSDTAYGALIENYAICGGYTDSMKLFLENLKIPSYKISSENHIWNLVYVSDNWYHLDLTWDDPVTSTGDDVLEYDYFLITTEELLNMGTDQHIFNSIIYKEAM